MMEPLFLLIICFNVLIFISSFSLKDNSYPLKQLTQMPSFKYDYRLARESDLLPISQLYVDVFEGPFTDAEKGNIDHTILVESANFLLKSRYIAQRDHDVPLAIFAATCSVQNQRHGRLFRSQKDQKLVGSIEIGTWAGEQFQLPFSSMFLANLVIDKDHRRRGIASRLIHQAENFALINSCCNVFTAVESNNFPAIHLYRKLGYKVLDDVQLPSQYANIVTIMERKLIQSNQRN
jgi:ribosomal protein S18 acetylase RimI-like enzyme